MPNLSAAGTQLVQELSQRYGISTAAVTHMLVAVQNGNGSMAQFNHPEFGGSGQWMRGGMTMVSDLFNHQLKARVDNLCSEIANRLADHQLTPFSGSFQSQSQNGMHSQSQAAGEMGSGNSLFIPDPSSSWWPAELGTPGAVGSQNNIRYAYFPQNHRLAVTTGGETWVYDTMDHQIGGFSQQQGSGGSITFTSQFGTVELSRLPVVSRGGVATKTPVPKRPAAQNDSTDRSVSHSADPVDEFTRESDTASRPPSQTPAGSGDIINLLERLGGLMEKGYITDDEFAAKKAELLSRL